VGTSQEESAGTYALNLVSCQIYIIEPEIYENPLSLEGGGGENINSIINLAFKVRSIVCSD
jgi:hypothetical protein